MLKIWRFLWGRISDASTLQWLFPTATATAMSYGAFVVAYVKQAPVWTWIPLTAVTAFCSLLAARSTLLLIELWGDRSPGAAAAKAHWENVIRGYDPRAREELRQFYITGNLGPVSADLKNQFFNDGLFIAGSGQIKPELKETVLKILRKRSP